MITAHLPSGYVLGRKVATHPAIFLAALVGAVFPDADLIWFYWIDDRAFHHHHYWVHIPGFWAITGVIVWPILRAVNTWGSTVFAAFLAGVALHIGLDAIAGGIAWGWPFNDTLYYAVSVPALGGHWIWNFILHPVFALELAIWVTAGWLFWNK